MGCSEHQQRIRILVTDMGVDRIAAAVVKDSLCTVIYFGKCISMIPGIIDACLVISVRILIKIIIEGEGNIPVFIRNCFINPGCIRIIRQSEIKACRGLIPVTFLTALTVIVPFAI